MKRRAWQQWPPGPAHSTSTTARRSARPSTSFRRAESARDVGLFPRSGYSAIAGQVHLPLHRAGLRRDGRERGAGELPAGPFRLLAAGARRRRERLRPRHPSSFGRRRRVQAATGFGRATSCRRAHRGRAALADEHAASTGRAIDGVAAMSGIFDLAPLVATSLNDKLRLDAASAAACSPLHRVRAHAAPMLVVVGEAKLRHSSIRAVACTRPGRARAIAAPCMSRRAPTTSACCGISCYRSTCSTS